MIIIKLLFLIVSLFSGIFCIIQLNRLPDEKIEPNGNYWRVAIYSSISGFYDVIMIVVLCQLIPEGNYGTGYEFMAALLILIIYTPVCFITSFKLKRRMRGYNGDKYDVRRINALNSTIPFKALFVLVEVVWMLEVK